MALNSYKSNYSNSFGGNPRSTISSIDEGGGIAFSRTSGQVPCYVMASASPILCDVGLPYEDLDYQWDFGDPSGTVTLANVGVGGGTFNYNSGQREPEAAYRYDVPGVYTVTLTIRANNGSRLISKTVIQYITVTAFSPATTYWADSAAGGTNAGTLANPFNTMAAIATALNGASNLLLHIKKGSSFTGTVGLLPWNVASDRLKLRIDTYGSGATPVINISSGSAKAFELNNGGSSSPSNKSDVVVDGIKFSNSGTASGPVAAAITTTPPTATISDIYFANCEFDLGSDSAYSNSMTLGGLQAANVGMWNCTLTAAASRTFGSQGSFLTATSWAFIVGGSIGGASNAAAGDGDHHVYSNVQYHSLYHNVDFQEGEFRNYCLNISWNRLGSAPEYSSYHVIANCNMEGIQRAHDASNNDNTPANVRFTNFVFSRNRVHDLLGDAIILFYCMETYTWRHNEIWNCGGGRGFAPGDVLFTILSSSAYGNKIYIPASASAGFMFSLPSASWTKRHGFTHNIIVDMRSAAQITAFPYAGLIDCDYNQYWAPNDINSKFMRDVGTDKTLAEQQAAGYDQHSVVADPGWTDAANGDFS